VVASRDAAAAGAETRRGYLWSQLMQRTFGLDVLACDQCGGRLRLIALIEEASVMQRILRHLGLPAEVPAAQPSRAPPLVDDHPSWDDARNGVEPSA